MDDLKQKLMQYYEQIEPTEEFRQRLLRLEDETDRTAAPRSHSRRRYLLPLAAMLAVAVAVGGGWEYLKQTMPQQTPDPGAIAEAPEPEPAAAGDAEAPALADEPSAAAEPKKPTPAGEQKKPAVTAEPTAEPKSAEADPNGKKNSDPATSPAANSPKEDTPEKPDEPPAGDPAPPEEPGSAVEDPYPPEPGAAAEDPTPPEPGAAAEESDPPPADDPPEETEPPAPVTLSADFYSSGGKDFVTVTNSSTGETVTFDVTGRCPAPRPAESGEEKEPASESAEKIPEQVYNFQRSAFGCDISISVTRDAAGGAQAYARPAP